MTETYPLHWPDGWPRTSANKQLWSLAGGRRHSQAWALVVDRLLGELDRIGAKQVVLSTNQPLRRDGLPYAATRRFEESGAAVYFTLNRQQLVMAQDRYELLADNIRSLALAIEGMRQMQRHGGGHMMERAFSGFAALPAPEAERHWSEVLGLSATASRDEIEKAYRSCAKTTHPDHGGSTEAMAALNVAYDEARANGCIQ